MAKRKTSSLLLVGIFALVLIAGMFGYFIMTTRQTQMGSNLSPVDCAESTGKLTVNAYSTLNPSTAVSAPTITAGVNDGVLATTVTSGTTTFPVGSKVEVLVVKDDYLDKSFEFVMPCGGQILAAPLYYSTSDNPSVRIKNDDGDYVTDNVAGGAVNQTLLAAGETLIMDIEIAGTSQESSGEGIYVIEFPAGSASNITKVELSGATLVSKPMVHTTLGAGSYVAAFKVPAVIGSEKAIHTLTVTLGATKLLSGGVYTDWYAMEEFIDDNGQVSYGVEDSDGTAQYENTLDFDFLINAA